MEIQLLIGSYIGFILVIYFLGKHTIGSRWALLPAFFASFMGIPETFAAGFNVIESTLILGTIFSILVLLKKTTLSQITLTGTLLGSTLAVSYDAIFLIIAYPILLTIFLTSSIATSWAETDPAIRALKFRVKIIRHVETLIKVIGIAIVILYASGFLKITVDAPPSSTLINWLNDNTALKPIGQYILGIKNYFSTNLSQNLLPPKSLMPSLIFVILGLILGTTRTIKSFFKSFKSRSSVLLDYLETSFQEFALIFTIALYIALIPAFPAPLATSYNILPLALILAVGAIKKWFYTREAEDFILRVSVFENNVLGFSLKSLAILCLMFWQILVGINF